MASLATQQMEAIAGLLSTTCRSPSFRDLKSATAFLHAKTISAETANEALQQEVAQLRLELEGRGRTIATLSRDAESSERSTRAAETAREAEAQRASTADAKAAIVHQRAQALEERLLEATAREGRLLDELSAARRASSSSMRDVANLSARSSSLEASLSQCEASRAEAFAQLQEAQVELHATRMELEAKALALVAEREQAAEVRAQYEAATQMLSGTREELSRASDRQQRSDGEIQALKRRAQEAAADAVDESEARTAAERMVFALREQNAMLGEDQAKLHRQLTAKERQCASAHHEVSVVGVEAQALAMRMGLYKAVLRSDVASVLAAGR